MNAPNFASAGWPSRLAGSVYLRCAVVVALVTAVVTAGLVVQHGPIGVQAATGQVSQRADDQAAHHAAGLHAGHGFVPTKAQEIAMVAQAAAAPLRGSEFRADCSSSHRRPDDPIVFPGRPGVSHIHEFFGNRTANASSTLQSLSRGTTNCNPAVDLSSYWTPTLYKDGRPVPPEHVTVYYQGITSPQRAVAPPRGLRYVVGNALATSPADNPAARWSCLGYPEASRDFLNCPAGSKLQNYLDFPTCWDGVRLDSPNHRDHMVYANGGIGGSCPASHPVAVPRVEFLITYPVNGGGLTLAGTRNGANVTTAPGYTFHGDFFNAWDSRELQRRVANCINAGYICGTDGVPIQQ